VRCIAAHNTGGREARYLPFNCGRAKAQLYNSVITQEDVSLSFFLFLRGFV
jgi:hypothetical protein